MSLKKVRWQAQQAIIMKKRGKKSSGCLGLMLNEWQMQEEIPVVNFGTTSILRCRRCRAYINAFVSFVDGGRRWKCNLCALLNEGDVEIQWWRLQSSQNARQKEGFWFGLLCCNRAGPLLTMAFGVAGFWIVWKQCLRSTSVLWMRTENEGMLRSDRSFVRVV